MLTSTPPLAPPIRVLLVDDSPVAVAILRRMLEASPEIVVVGVARDGVEALARVAELRPDVVCTDLHMPKMGGLELTRRLMATHPTPILVLSASVQPEQRANIFAVLEAGAVDIFPKPRGGLDVDFQETARELARKIRILRGVRVFRRAPRATTPRPGAVVAPPPVARPGVDAAAVVALGSSTGGPQALEAVLGALPASFPVPVLCVQHIATGFAEALATWLAGVCALDVRLARDGEALAPGVALVAPDSADLELDARGRVRVTTARGAGPRPSVDVTFSSIARRYGARAIGVLLTGMGADGARGLLEIASAGGFTIAQDEDTSVVFGMPREAIALGAARGVLPLPEIAGARERAVADHAARAAGGRP